MGTKAGFESELPDLSELSLEDLPMCTEPGLARSLRHVLARVDAPTSTVGGGTDNS